ncbi:carboxymuconolactone decarboxylase family protein [Collimonas sp.]|jgi:4-carboxymuconolactone decarboxylase|uniref:carboxymuconolactone decarboxylase family protein n=1 Tax=Collimonas sp. TaxID=1963772 RepID=UPI002B9F7E50|nr:carboxymuconolactone decarboxylase family protein [Collimonas sp.]HWX00282.1 carboxymuconolactone decarboxylase family protein [Collimonas sp.]
MQQSTYEKGLQRLKEVDDIAGEKVIASLADISPDLGRYVIEFGFGEIYSRPGLTLQQRELATVAALTAMGTAQPQLKVHLAAALNVGLSRLEITETIMQMALYAGFPAALNGMFAAKEVFAEHDRLAQQETSQY